MANSLLCLTPEALGVPVRVHAITSGMPQSFGVIVLAIDADSRIVQVKIVRSKDGQAVESREAVILATLDFNLHHFTAHASGRLFPLDAEILTKVVVLPYGKEWYAEFLALNVTCEDRALPFVGPVLLGTVPGCIKVKPVEKA